eukprot:8556113-Pyramimonas_sp.AAC.1
MFAALQVLMACLPPVVIVTNCKGMPDGPVRGPAWRLAPDRNNPDLWGAIWGKIQDLGGLQSGVSFELCKGHQRGGSEVAR